MGKNTRKPAVTRKTKHTPLANTSSQLVTLAKQKLIRKDSTHSPPIFTKHHMKQLVTEDILECSICLQLMLTPVLAQCGHSFCLLCAEDLATHGFACGICHTHYPTFDLPNSKVIETLLDKFLGECDC